jgi:hypothetical protein
LIAEHGLVCISTNSSTTASILAISVLVLSKLHFVSQK